MTLPVPDASRTALRTLIHDVWSGRFPELDTTITAISAPVVAAVLRDLAGRSPVPAMGDWLVREAGRIEAGTT